MRCREAGCEGTVEANASIWFSYDEEGGWRLYGVGDESARIVCDEGHDNATPVLVKELEAFIDMLLPGSTWTGSQPDRGDD